MSESDCHHGQWLRGVNQAYNRLSTTHGHITDCKLDSMLYAGVCVWINVDLSCMVRTTYAQQFLGAKPPIQFRHRWAEMNHSDHLYWLRVAQSVAELINAKRQAEKRKRPSFWGDAVGNRTPASRTLSGRSNHCATRGVGGGGVLTPMDVCVMGMLNHPNQSQGCRLLCAVRVPLVTLLLLTVLAAHTVSVQME